MLLCAFNFVFYFSSLFILSAVFISLWVGLGSIFCLLKNKISYFGVLYKYLNVGMEVAVIKELFILCVCVIYFPSICVFLCYFVVINTCLYACLCVIVI